MSPADLQMQTSERYCGPTTDLVSRNAFALEPEKDIEFAGRTARSTKICAAAQERFEKLLECPGQGFHSLAQHSAIAF